MTCLQCIVSPLILPLPSPPLPTQVTVRSPAPVPPLPAGVPTFKLISWNVNGFASLAKKSVETLRALVDKEKPDLLCLQETKLQPDNAPQYEAILPGYK